MADLTSNRDDSTRSQGSPSQNDRPDVVRGAYQPVGKVDIGAIRARAQKPEDAPRPVPRNEPTTLPERPAANQSAERLTNLPKPEVANKFGSGPSFPGDCTNEGGILSYAGKNDPRVLVRQSIRQTDSF